MDRKPEALEPVLSQVIAELRASWPDRAIDAEIFLTETINSDSGRSAQLLSNLLANALTYGRRTPLSGCEPRRGIGRLSLTFQRRDQTTEQELNDPFHHASPPLSAFPLGNERLALWSFKLHPAFNLRMDFSARG